MFLKRSYGIDLGSSSVKIYSNSKNKSYIQKNMIASTGRKIIAVGNEAYEMFEKEPSHISVSSPMAFGMIANVELQEIVLYVMIKKIVKFFGAGSTIYFSVPLDMTAVEKRAYYAVANGHWMRKNRVFMVEAPIVDAIAMGLDPERNEGSMIVNIGDVYKRQGEGYLWQKQRGASAPDRSRGAKGNPLREQTASWNGHAHPHCADSAKAD